MIIAASLNHPLLAPGGASLLITVAAGALRGFAKQPPLAGVGYSSGSDQASQEKVKQEPGKGSGREQEQQQIAYGSETIDPCPHDATPALVIGAPADYP
ncbi:MAG TPA: hypothetical protein VEI52_06565 [Terriglobales bacterium]|nr:hypothetical protein [Terriglobales bacterium]